jgi:hypothetical protein
MAHRISIEKNGKALMYRSFSRPLPSLRCIYQPPNAHVRISGILLSNAMAAAAVKKI